MPKIVNESVIDSEDDNVEFYSCQKNKKKKKKPVDFSIAQPKRHRNGKVLEAKLLNTEEVLTIVHVPEVSQANLKKRNQVTVISNTGEITTMTKTTMKMRTKQTKQRNLALPSQKILRNLVILIAIRRGIHANRLSFLTKLQHDDDAQVSVRC